MSRFIPLTLRTAACIGFLLLSLSLRGQRWERLDRSFRDHYADGEYVKAGEAAAEQVNYSLEHLDSTDLRYFRSYYNLALAYHGLDIWEEARSYLGVAYRLVVPFYSLHGGELAEICELYGRIETKMGNFGSARNFLTYAGEVWTALYGKESRPYLKTLYYLADLEMAGQEWDQMAAVLQEALGIHQARFTVDLEFAGYANYLGLIYLNNGNNREAAETFRRALTACGGPSGEAGLTCGHIHNNLGLTCYYLSEFEDAAFHFGQAENIYRGLLKRYSENYLMLLSNLASLYYSWGKPDLGSEAYRRLGSYLAEYPGQIDLHTIQAVENLAYYYTETGETRQAEWYHRKAIDDWRSTRPNERRELARKILQLSALFVEDNRPGLAVEEAEEAYRILSGGSAPGDPDLVSALLALGYACQRWERPYRAIYHYEKAREQVERSQEPPVPEAAMIYNNLGTLYLESGRLTEAVPCLERAHQLEPDDPVVLFNLGYALYGMQDPESAGEMFDRAREIYLEMYGPGHPDYAGALVMGVVSRSRVKEMDGDDLAEIMEAERILLESGTDSTDSRYTDCLDACRLYYLEQKDYRKALSYGDRSIRLTAARHGSRSPEVVQALLGQAGSITRMGDRKRLDELYGEVEAIIYLLPEEEQEDLRYLAESSKASNYYCLEEYGMARKSLEWAIGKDKARFLENQEIMTVQELGRYSVNLTGLMDYNNYLVLFPGDTEVISNAVNNRLFLKSILQEVERSRTWQQVRDALDPDEAAVEVIQFYHTTAPPRVTFHPWYFAFVITPEMEDAPLCIRLFDAMEVVPDYEAYRKVMETEGEGDLDPALYTKLWSAIDSAVAGRKTLYFSPDGIYHELNVEALVDRNGQYLLDRYRVRNVNTLADLLEEPGNYGDNRTALLAGDPMFAMSAADLPDPEPGSCDRQPGNFQSRMFPGTRLSPLPGTRTEVDSIGQLLEQSGWEMSLLTGAEATEGAVVSARNPRVLHLATHGYFAENRLQGSDTLWKSENRSYDFEDPENQARSCLFLAGAQNSLDYACDYSGGSGDGILTAWEISEMSLDSTELVVLSACETGLGDVVRSEGVTGLRRAFHLAGARRVMLSLWEVDDQATQLLMREFYSRWLSGMDVDLALTEAKRYLRDETSYSHPRYWAAFILTGI